MTRVMVGLRELKEEVRSLVKGVLAKAPVEKREEMEGLSTEVAKKIVTWPNNIPTGPRKALGNDVMTSGGRSVKDASVETEWYCGNQLAQKEMQEAQKQQQQQQAAQVVQPALPLGTPPRQKDEESSEESAYDTSRTFRQRCRRRLQDQKR